MTTASFDCVLTTWRQVALLGEWAETLGCQVQQVKREQDWYAVYLSKDGIVVSFNLMPSSKDDLRRVLAGNPR